MRGLGRGAGLPTPKGLIDVVGTARRVRTGVKINFAATEELVRVPGVGVKFAAKILRLRETMGNLKPEMLVACLGAKADKDMIGALDFEENPALLGLDEDETEDEGEDERLEAKMKVMVREAMKELVTPKKKSAPLFGKGKRAMKFSVGEDSDEESEEEIDFVQPRKSSRRRTPRGLPKNLSYDGKSNWAAFKQKFERYAEAYEWTEEECLNCLCWSLVGKAADFYATITERMEQLSFRSLVRKLEKRFGAKELAETSQAQFQQATQSEGESLEDWADRVLTLSTRAFKNLPEKYATQQAVVRFCQGLYDKAAAQDASIKRHQTIEEAMDHVKWFQHVHQAVYGKPKPGRRTKDLDEETPRVYEARTDPREGGASSSLTKSDVEEMVERLGETLMRKLSASKGDKKTNTAGGCYQCGQTGHIKRKCPEMKCFWCKKTGHFKRDCPEAPKGDLNGSGSSQKPYARPQK